MAANRLSALVWVALVPALLASACVSLTPPWVGAGNTDTNSAGGSAAGGFATGGTSAIDMGGAGVLAAGGTSGVVATGGVIGPGAGGAGAADTGGSTGAAAGGTVAADTGGTTATASGGTTVAGGGTADAAGTLGGSTSTGDAAPDLPLAKDAPAPVEAQLLQDAPIDPPSSPDVAVVSDTPLSSDVVDTAVSTVGLLAYYKCDETTGTILSDSSGNSNNGTLVGPAAFGPGKIGNALVLTATNGIDGGASGGYVELPAGLLSSTRTVTVAAWFKGNSTLSFQRVFDFGTSSTTSSMYLMPWNQTGFPQFSIRLVPEAGAEIKSDIISTVAITTNAWHHAAVVLDASGGRLYMDGVQVGTNTTMTLRPADLDTMPNDWIGRSEFATNPYFDGDIDEFRVYNRALTAAEISALSAP